MNKLWLFVSMTGIPFPGCSNSKDSYRFETVSDTSWIDVCGHAAHHAGAVTVSGTGDKTVPISWFPPMCIPVAGGRTLR